MNSLMVARKKKKGKPCICVSVSRGTGLDRGQYGVATAQAQPIRGCGMRPKPEMDEMGKLSGKMLLAEFEKASDGQA
jgi:hypothetical protein